jgi:hypothetical protein
MPIFDQFDIENKNSFESSSIDRVFFGSIFNQKSNLMSFQNSPRYVIGGKLEKINEEIFDTVGLWRYTDWDQYQSGSPFPGLSRTIQGFDSNEIFYDSQAPDLQPFLIRAGCEIVGYIDPFRLVVEQPLLDIKVDQRVLQVNVPYKGTGNIYHSFPFQYEFSDIKRLVGQSNFFVSTTSVGTVSTLDFFTLEDESLENMIIVDVTASFSQGQDFSSINSGLEDGAYFPTRINELYKTIFGFGDGLGIELIDQSWGFVQYFNQYPSFKRYHFPDPKFLLLPVIRGYRYGMISHAPKARKHHFNRNHYGYFADKLESEPYSTMFSQPSNIDNVCTVAFVSGSKSAVSASLTAAIVKNSGIYNKNYRAATPFFDT